MNTSILMVDDSIFDLDINMAMFNKNYKGNKRLNCIKAFNGEEALQLLDSLNEMSKYGNCDYPHLILLDLNMPKLNGHEFLQEFQKKIQFNNWMDANVVVLTSSENEKDRDSSLQFDCVVEYLTKPLTKTKVCELIKRYVA